MPWRNRRSGGPAPTLIKSDGTTKSAYPCLNPCVNDSNLMSFHSPYATTIWDYINRAMPLTKEGTLKPNEVYSLVAFLLYNNGVIKEDEVMDAQSSAEGWGNAKSAITSPWPRNGSTGHQGFRVTPDPCSNRTPTR